MKRIVLLGATGSIGKSTFALYEKNPEIFQIIGASAHSQYQELEKISDKYKITHLLDTRELGQGYPFEEKFQKFLEKTKPDIVLNAVVGYAGMKFSLETLKSGITLALANKESLVAAGSIMMEASKKYNAPIIPVDSEHAAIFECLINYPEKISHSPTLQKKGTLSGSTYRFDYKKFQKILLTCSGGPFFGKTAEELSTVTKAQALNHPNWDMGAKISIDSATLANKCLEFFEAMHLFGANKDQIEIVIHRESIIHSMVEFADSSILSQMAPPNMELPIAMALNFPEKIDMKLPRQSFDGLNLSFYKPDQNVFRTLKVLKHCAEYMGNLPIVFNAVNEVAVAEFLAEKIKFTQIFDVLESVCFDTKPREVIDIADVEVIDREARELAKKFFNKGS